AGAEIDAGSKGTEVVQRRNRVGASIDLGLEVRILRIDRAARPDGLVYAVVGLEVYGVLAFGADREGLVVVVDHALSVVVIVGYGQRLHGACRAVHEDADEQRRPVVVRL